VFWCEVLHLALSYVTHSLAMPVLIFVKPVLKKNALSGICSFISLVCMHMQLASFSTINMYRQDMNIVLDSPSDTLHKGLAL
jgi:hypothetical protein